MLDKVRHGAKCTCLHMACYMHFRKIFVYGTYKECTKILKRAWSARGALLLKRVPAPESCRLCFISQKFDYLERTKYS